MTILDETLEDDPWYFNSQAISLLAVYMLNDDRYTKHDLWLCFERPEDCHEAYIEMQAVMMNFFDDLLDE